MNYMLQNIEQDIKNILINSYNNQINNDDLKKLVIELPPIKLENDFDISTNIALILTKKLKQKPMEIANNIVKKLSKIDYIENIDLSKPAFINIKLKDNFLFKIIENINNFGDKNLTKNIGNGEKINVEFCSANPTGPLHIGHARGTIFGDVISNLLEKSGYNVCREYYINDAGEQMKKLENSIKWRMNNDNIEDLPEDYYPGEYLQEIAEKRNNVLKKNPNKTWSNTETAMEMIEYFIKPTLKKLKINYNCWTSEQSLKDNNAIKKSIDHLSKLDLIYKGVLQQPKGKIIEDYEPREQLLFKSSKFGDDVDRPLMKNDGSYTYFSSDIAYHYDKWKRGFNNMVVVLGADHKGYVKRLTSAVKAISNEKGDLHIKLCELVNFMKNGKMVKMSKRKNNFLTIDDVLEKIDSDILRFIILTRKADTVLNFDLEKAKEQSKDNPIWYIHYAYARCNSVLNKSKDLKTKLQKNINENTNLSCDFHKLIVKMMFYTRFLELSVQNYEPYFFVNYLTQLATEFHKLWEKEKFIDEDKNKTFLKLSVISGVKRLIKEGLKNLGINAIEQM